MRPSRPCSGTPRRTRTTSCANTIRGSTHDERHGFSFDRAEARTASVFDVTLRVLRVAEEEGASPAVAADRLAEERMRSVGRLATIRLPH